MRLRLWFVNIPMTYRIDPLFRSNRPVCRVQKSIQYASASMLSPMLSYATGQLADHDCRADVYDAVEVCAFGGGYGMAFARMSRYQLLAAIGLYQGITGM